MITVVRWSKAGEGGHWGNSLEVAPSLLALLPDPSMSGHELSSMTPLCHDELFHCEPRAVELSIYELTDLKS